MSWLIRISIAMATVALVGCSDPIPTVSIPDPPAPVDRVVASAEWGYSSGVRTIIADGEFVVGIGIGGNGPVENLVLRTSVDPRDTGRMIVNESNEDDADYSTFVELLTNGDVDFMRPVATGPLAGSTVPASQERDFLSAANGVAINPDLRGQRITRLVLTVLNVALATPGSNPNGDGIWTDAGIRVRLDVYAANG